MAEAALVVGVLGLSVVGFLVLYVLIERETDGGETMDRTEAERRARRDTEDGSGRDRPR